MPRLDEDIARGAWEEVVRYLTPSDSAVFNERVLGAARTRASSAELSRKLDEMLLIEIVRLRDGLRSAATQQSDLKRMLETVTAPPLHTAVFLGLTELDRGTSALVVYGQARRAVTISDRVDPASLLPGDEVLLGPELNVIVAVLPERSLVTGDTATFDRLTADGRIVLKYREEEIVVEAAMELRNAALRAGDVVRWSRDLGFAFERLERSGGSRLFLEETPRETFAEIGGLDKEVAEITKSIVLQRDHPDTVRRYGLKPKGSVLLVGPPGTGKTLIARALANWLAGPSPGGRARWLHVKPGGLASMWYGQSEAHVRDAFQVAKEASLTEPEVPVVVFFDEVDAIGAARGASINRVDDRVLLALMAELDGFESRGNVLVVAATNRRDTLDPALLRPGRLGDLVLEIPRPGRDAGREIFARHLPATVPVADAEGGSRTELIEAAVSRIYAPNGIGELARVTFRDGKRRAVSAPDLVTGAVIARISQRAIERACRRDADRGDVGLRPSDLFEATDEVLGVSVRALAPGNCRRHLDDLPDDVDVVRVEPVVRQVRREHRYLRIA